MACSLPLPEPENSCGVSNAPCPLPPPAACPVLLESYSHPGLLGPGHVLRSLQGWATAVLGV